VGGSVWHTRPVDVTPLESGTRELLDRLFTGEGRAEAERLLVEECGSELGAGPELARVRWAVLRASGGDPGRLQLALDLAWADWRDLLRIVGSGEDPLASPRRPPPRRHRRRWRIPQDTGVVPFVVFFTSVGGLGTLALWVWKTLWGSCQGAMCGLGVLGAAGYALFFAVLTGGFTATVALNRHPDQVKRVSRSTWAKSAVIAALALWVAHVTLKK